MRIQEEITRMLKGRRCAFLLYTGATLESSGWLRVDKRRLDIVPRCLQAIYCHSPLGGLDAVTIIYGGGRVLLVEDIPCSVSEKPIRRHLSRITPIEAEDYTALINAARGAGLAPVLLTEDGDPWPPRSQRPRLYIIGTSIDPPYTGSEEKVSLGPKSYLASQVAAYIALHERGLLGDEEG